MREDGMVRNVARWGGEEGRRLVVSCAYSFACELQVAIFFLLEV